MSNFIGGLISPLFLWENKMDYGDEQCVGCDASTKGTYRQEPNWHLCNECFKSWLEEKVEENNLTSRRID